ncbi:MAG: MFS transporter, partial [Spirochaetales bacterium]|nr:MFS transporter [Spirochaetales bacterium]
MYKKPINQRITYLIILGVGAKLLIDTTIQLFNPFLIIIAAGVGISVVSMGGVVALRGLVGIIAPLIGSLADKIGYKKVMLISLLITGIGMLIAGFSWNSSILIAAM